MYEVLGILCGLAVLAALIGCVIVLPIVAFLRTGRIAELSKRVARLEQELGEFRRGGAPIPPAAVETVEAIREAPREEAVAMEPMDVLPTEAPAPAAEPVGHAAPQPGFDLETWIGRHGLGWVAVILLLFATAFFLKYAFDNEWVGALGRVAIGVLGGVALCVSGLVCHRRGWWLFAQMLSAGGVVLLYLTTFAAFGYYRLMPQDHAGLFLIALIAETFALATLYEAPAIALMAVIGGLLTPLLLRTDHDQYRNLFTYLGLLNAGVVGLGMFRSWRFVATVSLVGTQALFWGWYNDRYHPEKLAACLIFETALFALYLVYGWFAHVWKPRRATIEDLIRLAVNAILFAVIGYVLLDEDYHIVMGTLAVVLGMVYTGLAWLIQSRRPDDERQLLVVLAVAFGFVAMVIPLQAQAAWITVGWAAQGLALWWFGLRVRGRALQGFGAVLLMLAIGHFLFVDTPEARGRLLFVPLFNSYGLPSTLLVSCVFAAAVFTRRFLPRLDPGYRVIMQLIALAGVGITWVFLSKETYDFFYAYYDGQPGRYDHWANRAALTSLSVVWAIYAFVLLGIGFRIQSGVLRWSALALFALTLAKAFVFDMSELPGFYRVTAFFVLAVMMAAAAWGYQKFQQLASRREGGS